MLPELGAWWHKIERKSLSEKAHAKHTQIDSCHGRIETLTCEQLLVDKSGLGKNYRWSGLRSIIKIHAKIYEQSTDKETEETCWYISSLDLNTEQASKAVRSHWQVENIDWVLELPSEKMNLV